MLCPQGRQSTVCPRPRCRAGCHTARPVPEHSRDTWCTQSALSTALTHSSAATHDLIAYSAHAIDHTGLPLELQKGRSQRCKWQASDFAGSVGVCSGQVSWSLLRHENAPWLASSEPGSAGSHRYWLPPRQGTSAVRQMSRGDGQELTQMPLANQRFRGLVSSKGSSQYRSSATPRFAGHAQDTRQQGAACFFIQGLRTRMQGPPLPLRSTVMPFHSFNSPHEKPNMSVGCVSLLG